VKENALREFQYPNTSKRRMPGLIRKRGSKLENSIKNNGVKACLVITILHILTDQAPYSL
jgi:hypothetical protein